MNLGLWKRDPHLARNQQEGLVRLRSFWHDARLTAAWTALTLSALVGSSPPAGAAAADLVSAAMADLSPGDRSRLARGEPVARVIDTEDNLEIFVLGMVRVSASRERALELFRDPKAMRPAETLYQMGRVSQPARIEDFASLVVDADDARDLYRCRLGKCEVRLPDEEGGHVPLVGPQTPGGTAPGDFMKHLLLTRAQQYETRGSAGLPVYEDRARPVQMGDVLTKLLRLPPWVDSTLPEVRAHMDAYPAQPSGGAEDFLYWMQEKRYRAPVVSLTHAAVFPSACGGECVALADRQVYASHYYEASLDLFVWVPGNGTSYLVYLNRSRADNNRPRFYWFERALLELMVKKMMRSDLTRLAGRLAPVAAQSKTGR